MKEVHYKNFSNKAFPNVIFTLMIYLTMLCLVHERQVFIKLSDNKCEKNNMSRCFVTTDNILHVIHYLDILQTQPFRSWIFYCQQA